MKEIDEAKKHLKSALLSGDWNQSIAYVRVAIALLEAAKAEPEAKVLSVNTDGMRRKAQSVKDGQGTQVGSLALMLIDCCDYIDRLIANH